MLSILRGKYRNIIFAVAVFIVLDASILSLNFYISYALSGDAIAVAKAGELRMMSQRVVKSLYELQVDMNEQRNPERPFIELKQTVLDFDEILTAFNDGGLISAGETQAVELAKVSREEGKKILRQMNDVWRPFNAIIYPIVAVPEPVQDEWFNKGLMEAERYAASNNITLLTLSGELAAHTETVATQKAANLRLGQTVGIILAILNFFIIVYHLIRQLRRTDEKIAEAQEETRQILDTVSEGLFLIDKDLTISGQHSRFAEEILGTNDITGKRLTTLLADKVSQEVISTLSRYLSVLLNGRVKQDLAMDLNPLSRVQMALQKSNGQLESKTVSFNFSRALDKHGNVSHILVTIQDTTALSDAEATIVKLNQSQGGQMDVVAKIMDITPVRFREFCDQMLVNLLDINKILKKPSRQAEQFKSQIELINMELHRMKGESAMLGFESIATAIHELESQLIQLQKNDQLDGKDFVPFIVRLKQLISEVERLLELVHSLLRQDQARADNKQRPASGDLINPRMVENLVQNIAKKSNKQVRFMLSQYGVDHIPSHLHQPIRDLIVQLVRNAVVHGLEETSGRRNKSTAGQVQVEIRASVHEVTLVVADDGRGISTAKLKQRALVMGAYTEHELSQWNQRQLLQLMFESGLSTSAHVDEDAGRGVGMLAVKTMVQRLAGKIAIRNREGEGTRFIIRLPLLMNTQAVNKVYALEAS